MVNSKTIRIIDEIIHASKTKLINPIVFLASLNLFLKNKKVFTRKELESEYKKSVKEVKEFIKSDLNIGGKFHPNTYPDRMASKYGIFMILKDNKLKLPSFIATQDIVSIKNLLLEKLFNIQKTKIGSLQLIDEDPKRAKISKDKNKFTNFLTEEFQRSANSFEITCFSVLKVFLEKFACKLYRNSRTNARDSGVDISTDFGVVYQVKKFKIKEKKEIDKILKEVNTNFDYSRIKDGKLVLIIEDIDANFKHFILGKNIKMFKMSDILKISNQIDEIEDRMKILRVIYDETRRELKSDI